MRFARAALSLLAAASAAFALTACGASSSSGQNGASGFSRATNPLPQLVTISPELKMLYIPEKTHVQPPAGVPKIINSWASLSQAISGVPCINCVGSPPIAGALGIAFPDSYLLHNGGFEITYVFYNVAEGSSPCVLTFTMTQNKVALLKKTFNITLNGNGQYVYFMGGPMPGGAVAGAASVSADVKCNGFSPKAATENVYFS
ncbi:MAG TPA: hypothetical protein VFA29_12295 [Candidatus Baltobacteraceae bacterium]|nr:hypothetical protein [Candidatus Baltobacteraceae bacterium]